MRNKYFLVLLFVFLAFGIFWAFVIPDQSPVNGKITGVKELTGSSKNGQIEVIPFFEITSPENIRYYIYGTVRDYLTFQKGDEVRVDVTSKIFDEVTGSYRLTGIIKPAIRKPPKIGSR